MFKQSTTNEETTMTRLFIVTVKTSRIHVTAKSSSEAIAIVKRDGYSGYTIVSEKLSPNFEQRLFKTVI